ncbi:MAG: transposase [Acidobacteriaceae bacterium]
MPTPLSPTETYFVTSATFQRKSLFHVEAKAQLFMETLQDYRTQGKYKLHAFVVMPDHFHLLVTPLGITIERAVGLIKGGFSHRVGSKFPVWQKGFHERRMRDAEEFIARREYIHQNPVRAHLAASAEDYPFSSAFLTRPAAAEAVEL